MLIKEHPLKYRDLALEESKRQYPYRTAEEIMEYTIGQAFNWASSPQGQQFWHDVHYGDYPPIPGQKQEVIISNYSIF